VLSGAALFALSALPWFTVMLVKYGWVFFDKFIVSENLHRFTEAQRGHTGDVSFYFGTMFHGMFPWIGFVPAALAWVFCGPRQLDEKAKQNWFYLSWFFATFSVVSFAGTKLNHYLLPLAPAAAVLVAILWERCLEKDAPFWCRVVPLISLWLTALTIRDFLDPNRGTGYILGAFTSHHSIDNVPVVSFLIGLLIAWAIVMAVAAVRCSFMVIAASILIAFANGIYFCHRVLPKQEYKHSLRSYVEFYMNHREPEAELFFMGEVRRYTIDYYLPEKIYRRFQPNQGAQLATHTTSGRVFYIIVRTPAANKLREQLEALDPKGRWWNVVLSTNSRYVILSNSPQFKLPRVTPRVG
jgi:hypothetical protein